MSTLNVATLQNSGGTGTAATLASINGGPISGARNKVIGGCMRIDQRNAGASVTIGATSVTYVVDRFAGYADQASKFSLQQSTVAPPGFTNSLLATSLSAYSVLAGDRFNIRHHIEGFNTADLAWGTASASAATLSFWVRSSLTGTFGGSLRNSAGTRSYPFTYSISAANTWEYKSITVPGETTGTWVTNNGIGITLFFSLGTGSTNSGTPGAWANSDFVSATGATSVVGTNGATFYITGVQLEQGTVSSPFERRSYGQELMLCQRYFQKSAPGTDVFRNGTVSAGAATTGDITTWITLVATMRAAPTLSVTDRAGNAGKCSRLQVGVLWTDNQTVTLGNTSTDSFYYVSPSGANASGAFVIYSVSAEL